MASQDAPEHRPSLYPKVDLSNPLVETLITVPGAIVHLIDDQQSVELANGEFSVVRNRHGDNVITVLARLGNEVWPLSKDGVANKVNDTHYSFSFRSPKDSSSWMKSNDDKIKGKRKDMKNKEIKTEEYDEVTYGLTFTSKGQEKVLEELDKVLKTYTVFSEQSVAVKGGALLVVTEASLENEDEIEERCATSLTVLAPNVDDYDGVVAKMIAACSGQLIRGILWCGDVTVDKLKWGNEVLKTRMSSNDHKLEISPNTLSIIKRVNRGTKTTHKVADVVLDGVVKVSGRFTSSVANSAVGRKFFSKLPGEILLASFDGLNKVGDAIEVAGKNVMTTSSTVTASLVTHKYGEQAGEAIQEGLRAAGHVIWTAWTVFKIRKILKPKGALKKIALAKSVAETTADEYKAERDTEPK